MATLFDSTARAVGVDVRAAQRFAPLLATALAALGVLGVHWDTVASIVAIWIRSETFAHGFVVVPIALWLAWRRRADLAATPARPWYPGLGAVALAGALWFVTAAADVLGVRQFALAFMVQAAIVTVVGLAVARAAAFPLLFLLFAVPAGEILLPVLIDWTADFTVAALQLSGVPVYREANHFVIPSGAWSVVEACSGLRYLIASFMIGVVYASMSYRSRLRKLAFVAASILVPIVANWLRAYMIVMIGHLSDNRLAVGVDHIIYGWLFFGVVMALLFWVGSWWAEPEAPRAESVTRAAALPAAPASAFYVAAIAAIAVAGIWWPAFTAIEREPSKVVPVVERIAAAGGFVPATEGLPEWKPAYKGASAELRQSFAKDGATVGLHVAYYRNQSKGRELVTSGNALVGMGDNRWREVERDEATVRYEGRDVVAARSIVSGNDTRLAAYKLYWVDGRVTSSDYVAKAILSWSRLTGGSDDAALVVFYARAADASALVPAAIAALSPGLDAALRRTRESR